MKLRGFKNVEQKLLLFVFAYTTIGDKPINKLRTWKVNKYLVQNIKIVVLALTLSVVSFPTMAANWNWLKNSPAEAFTDSDWAMLKQTGREALEKGDNGTTALWLNHDTGHSGSITPLTKTDNNGLPCRKTKFFNSANGMTGSATFRLCKQPDGTWKIAP